MIDKEEKFYNRFFVYVNQVFGEKQLRKVITKILDLPTKSLKIITGDNGYGEIWEHHVALDIETDNIVCSVEKGQQDINTTDTACQSYSIYNVIIFNREYILERTKDTKVYNMVENLEPLKRISNYGRTNPKRSEILKENTEKIANLLLWLLKQKNVKEEIQALEFIRYKDEDTGEYYVPGRGETLSNVVKKTSDVLKEWKSYGYKFFLRKE